MGYDTQFSGQIDLDRQADPDVVYLMKGLSETRRMRRNVDENLYGKEGAFYFNFDGNFGQSRDASILDYNTPPAGQPGLWCQWRLDDDLSAIVWDEGEKFYSYVEWMEYLINKIFAPRGYVLNGEIEWRGDDYDDHGILAVKDNTIHIRQAVTSFNDLFTIEPDPDERPFVPVRD